MRREKLERWWFGKDSQFDTPEIVDLYAERSRQFEHVLLLGGFAYTRGSQNVQERKGRFHSYH